MSTLSEHQGNGIRFDMHLSAPNGGVAQMLCRPDGQWVSWNEYEKLKAEVERLRLQVGTDAIDREHGMCCDSSAENARLKAEVERLRKAGDAMAKVIPDIMDYRFDGNECDKELKAWNAAKEGKQP